MTPASGPGMPALSDDARLELAMQASARERASRPARWLVLAGLVLAVSLLVCGMALWSRSKAMSDARRQIGMKSGVESMLVEYERLAAKGDSGEAAQWRRIADILSRMENLGTRAGLKQKPPPPQESPAVTRDGITTRTYRYGPIADPSLKALLEWLSLLESEIPGMRVYDVQLRPDPSNWTMSVTLRRWEKAG